MKYFFRSILIFLLLILTIPNSKGDKIQIGDNWKYTDNIGNIHNETAVGNTQIIADSNVVSTMIVNTTRGFQFPMNSHISLVSSNVSETSIIFNLNFEFSSLFITQEGGITLFPIIENSNGTVEGNYNGDKKAFPVTDLKFTLVEGDPSLALISGASQKYIINAQLYNFQGDISGVEELPEFYDVHYKQEIVISSNNNPEDTIRNFTITPISLNVEFNYENFTGIDEVFIIRYTETLTEIIQTVGTSTSPTTETIVKTENRFLEPNQIYSYEKGLNQANYIQQSESVSTTQQGSSGEMNIVEYFLNRELNNPNTTSIGQSNLTSTIPSSEATQSSPNSLNYPNIGFFSIIMILIIFQKHFRKIQPKIDN